MSSSQKISKCLNTSKLERKTKEENVGQINKLRIMSCSSITNKSNSGDNNYNNNKSNRMTTEKYIINSNNYSTYWKRIGITICRINENKDDLAWESHRRQEIHNKQQINSKWIHMLQTRSNNLKVLNMSPSANKSLGFILKSQLNPEEAASLRFKGDHLI